MDADTKSIIKLGVALVALCVAIAWFSINYTFTSSTTIRNSDGSCWVYVTETKGNSSIMTTTRCEGEG